MYGEKQPSDFLFCRSRVSGLGCNSSRGGLCSLELYLRSFCFL